MGRAVVFLLSVLFLNTVYAENACFDIFTSSSMPEPFKEQRSISNPTDIKETGIFIDAKSRKGLEDVVLLMNLRDGTYPLLIDANKNVIIENRLPDVRVNPNGPYLATHRGLFAKLYQLTGHRPRIVFAGQIRVVGHNKLNIIDQAGTFFQVIEDFKDFGSTAFQALIQANQQRLDWAATYLTELGLVDSQTIRINFRKQYANYGQSLLNEGHTQARAAAEFELRCRANPACADEAAFVQRYVNWVMAQGGQKFLEAKDDEFKAKDRDRAFEFNQWMNLLVNEGVFDVMTGADLIHNPQGQRALDFRRFLLDLEFFLGDVPLYL